MLTVSSLSVSNGVRLSLIKSTCICPACPYIRFAFSPPIFMLITGNVASSRSILLSVVSLFIRLLKPITPSIKTNRRIPAFVSIFFIDLWFPSKNSSFWSVGFTWNASMQASHAAFCCSLYFLFSFFTARINRFFGVCSISINSRICVSYPLLSSIWARSPSVKIAENRSFKIPYSKIGASVSFFICRFNSCWQHGTERITDAFHLTAFSNA